MKEKREREKKEKRKKREEKEKKFYRRKPHKIVFLKVILKV